MLITFKNKCNFYNKIMYKIKNNNFTFLHLTQYFYKFMLKKVKIKIIKNTIFLLKY